MTQTMQRPPERHPAPIPRQTVVLHVGYHKTGSSWLQTAVFPLLEHATLVMNSEVVIDEIVGVDPFRFDAQRARSRILASRAPGRVVVVSMERLSGHPDSGGFDAKLIADRLGEVFPEGRALIVIRRQEEMIPAVYGEYVRTGGVESLKRYLRPVRGAHRNPRFDRRHLEYDRLVAHYQSLLGRERVCVLAYEQLRTDPMRFAHEVAAFCDLELQRPLDTSLVHPSLSPMTIAIKRRLNRIVARDAVNPGGLLEHEGAANSLARVLNHVDRRLPAAVRRAGRGRLERIAREHCGDYYRASNQRTTELSGLDLGSLGYSL